MQEQITLCACGCGRALSDRAGVGAKFVRGHYWRVQKRPFGIRPLIPLATRFWAKVQKTDGCWLWIGAINSRGYGSIGMGKRGSSDEAHRVSWRLHFGDIPSRLWVLHHCDIRACVRPDHLFLGDVQANTDDMNAKGRGVLPKRQPTLAERARGERHGEARASDAVVREVRRRYSEEGVSQQSLAAEYGLGQSTISRILRRESWAHVL